MNFKKTSKSLLVCVLYIYSFSLFAAGNNFIKVESFIQKPDKAVNILPFSINLASFPKPLKKESVKNLQDLDSNFVYVTKVKVKNKIYFRLVLGNFITQDQANEQLNRVKIFYSGAWINKRSQIEKENLRKMLVTVEEKQPIKVISVPVKKPATNLKSRVNSNIGFTEKLLKQAKKLLLDQNYTRVIAVADKILETGTADQKQKAMELQGIARERQNKFAHAIAIYTEFLSLYPDSDLAPKIKTRLTGLKTMRMEPKSRLVKRERQPQRRTVNEAWNVFGAFSQYYRDDIIQSDETGSEEINQSLLSDINILARRRTDKEILVLRLDAGLNNDFLENETDSRLSRAMVDYLNKESGYQLIAGRQSRTAKGVLGRFDGFLYRGLSHPDFNYSVYTGFPVQSSSDSLETNRKFYGGSINFKPYDKVELDVYLIQQEIAGLTDRQAVGSEIQYQSDKGFIFNSIDYDLFYSNLNNITTISSYRVDDKWTLNLTYDYRNTPLLTTINAIQGQGVASIEELLDIFTKDEIYRLAEDRTSKSQNLFLGSNYQIDDRHQIFLSLSLSEIEETEASSNVAATPSTTDINLAGDYSIRGYFLEDDFTTFGLRISDTTSSETTSIRLRTRFPGSKGFRYDPRIRLDFRKNKSSDVKQWTLKPSFKVTYKASKKLSFEASLGVEYSSTDLPEQSDQTAYNLFLGYIYQF